MYHRGQEATAATGSSAAYPWRLNTVASCLEMNGNIDSDEN